jgi:methylase of polypeptide subunit release factors
MRKPRRRIAVVGSGHGELALALAAAFVDEVIAGFDADPRAVAHARWSAAREGLADRVTFEVTQPGTLLGSGYDLIVLTRSTRRR